MRAAALLLLVLALAGCATMRPTESLPYYLDVLVPNPFTSIVVELDHAPSVVPSEAATTHLLSTLRNVTHKDVRLVLDASLPDDASHRWTSEELVRLERATRTTAHVAPVAVLHVLYPAGVFEKDGVAGVTVAGTQIGPVTIFQATLASCRLAPGAPALPNPTSAEATLERATLLHESGHAVGLVDNGLRMVRDHEDKEHPGHSSHDASVMYWALDTCAGAQQLVLGTGVPSTFDADDLADLRAVAP